MALYGYGQLNAAWYAEPSLHPRHNPRPVSRAEAERQTDGTIISDTRDRRGDGGLIYLYYRQHGLWPREVSGFDPTTLAAEIAPFEPARNVTADYPPTLLIHGTRDTDVPYAESELMALRLREKGVAVTLLPIDDAEHGFAGGDPQQVAAAYQKMRAFIVAQLGVD